MHGKPGNWADSGAWIGLLSVVLAIAIAVWMVMRVPTLPPAALLFVGLTVLPYLIDGLVVGGGVLGQDRDREQ